MQDNSIIWKPVVGYEDSYVVAASGVVHSLGRINSTCYGSTRSLKTKQMTASMDSRGYMCVKLSSNNKTTTHRVHRLVMMAFSPNDNHEKLDVNHKDGDKTNNNLKNLEWCTRGENHKHRYQVLGQKHSFVGRIGKLHPRSKAVIGINLKTGETVMFESANQASIKLGMCFSKICACARGERGTHKGYTWQWYGPEAELAELVREVMI